MSELRARQVASQREFFRLLGAAGPGSAVKNFPGGIQATAAPIRPWFSIFNSVVATEASDLAGHLDDLASFYRQVGSLSWAIWVPPWREELEQGLAEGGLKIDSTPLAMGGEIEEIDIEPRVGLDLMREPTAELVARVNDLAHGVLPEWSMSPVFQELDQVRPYVALVNGEPAAALLALHFDADCYYWFVGTAPEFQRRGLGAELMRHSLREARAQGCLTTTLESTAVAEGMYAALGFRSLGRYAMWECRPTNP